MFNLAPARYISLQLATSRFNTLHLTLSRLKSFLHVMFFLVSLAVRSFKQTDIHYSTAHSLIFFIRNIFASCVFPTSYIYISIPSSYLLSLHLSTSSPLLTFYSFPLILPCSPHSPPPPSPSCAYPSYQYQPSRGVGGLVGVGEWGTFQLYW